MGEAIKVTQNMCDKESKERKGKKTKQGDNGGRR